MAQPRVNIILLNYNGYIDTIDCINSLENIDYKNYEIIVVDNKSTNNSVVEIKKHIHGKQNIVLIESKENLGFSGGNNLGIEYSLKKEADYICLLNNDTTVEPNFLNPLINIMEESDEIGITSGKIMYYGNKNIIWSAGGTINKDKAIGYNLGIDEEDNPLLDEIKEVTFLTGCLQLIRRDVFEKIGLYDHQYFLYMEDVDFCQRTINSGYKLIFVPESKIYHKVSASTGGDVSPMVVYYMTRNRLLFNSKYNENIQAKIKFYMFYTVKLISEPIRKKISSKYIIAAIKDFKLKRFGFRDINNI